ncbi:MAG: hypothetical protein AVDCRST_MAG55-1544, partial [uncultured Rubrobacteraceae bacterium]
GSRWAPAPYRNTPGASSVQARPRALPARRRGVPVDGRSVRDRPRRPERDSHGGRRDPALLLRGGPGASRHLRGSRWTPPTDFSGLHRRHAAV